MGRLGVPRPRRSLIPVRRNSDTRPLPGPDGADAISISNQPLPFGFTGFEDVAESLSADLRALIMRCEGLLCGLRSPGMLSQASELGEMPTSSLGAGEQSAFRMWPPLRASSSGPWIPAADAPVLPTDSASQSM